MPKVILHPGGMHADVHRDDGTVISGVPTSAIAPQLLAQAAIDHLAKNAVKNATGDVAPMVPQTVDSGVQPLSLPPEPLVSTPSQGVVVGPGTVFDPVTGAPSNPVQGAPQPSDDDIAAANMTKPSAVAAPAPIKTGARAAADLAAPAQTPAKPIQTGGFGSHQSEFDKLSKANQASAGQQIQGIGEEQKAIKAGADLTAGAYHTQAESDQAQAQAQAESAESRRQYYAKAMDRIQQATDDLAHNSTIDPNQYLKHVGIGQTIGTAFAQILGGMGAGVLHQSNAATDFVNNQIKNNIEAQAENIKSKRAGINDQYNLVAQFMKNGLDMDEARAAAYKATASMYANKIHEFEQDTTGGKSIGLADQLSGKVLGEANDKQSEILSKKLGAQGQAQESQLRGLQIQEGKMGLENAIAQRDWAKTQGLPPGTNPANVSRGLDGSAYVGQSQDQVKAFNTMAGPAQEIKQILGEIDQARKGGVLKNQGGLKTRAGRLKQLVAELGGEKESQRTDEIIESLSGKPDQMLSILPANNWEEHRQALGTLANDRIANAAAQNNMSEIRKPADAMGFSPARRLVARRDATARD